MCCLLSFVLWHYATSVVGLKVVASKEVELLLVVGLLVVAVEPKVLRLAFAAMSAAELACCVASTPPPDRKFEKVHLRIQRLTKPITVQSIADEGKGSRG